MTSETFTLERTVLICAPRATVFRYFTDSDRFAAWWGEGSTIDARPGGAVVIHYPGGVVARGAVEELAPGERIVFTYGYDDASKPIRPGGSRVVVTLEDREEGTLLRLRHDFADAATRDHHVQGWRYQLAVFANVAAREHHARAADTVDRYFTLWSEPDAAARERGLREVVVPDFVFQDAFSCTAGADEFDTHMGATRIHMPGLRLRREGDVRQCQGTVLADWVAEKPDGSRAGGGTNVFRLAPDGRLRHVVGFWSSPRSA
jgi:uncharacterized protein YndB with AHSA1/START domain